MPRHTAELLNQLQHADGVLVSVDSVQGSGPREVGAWMAVFPHTLVNTIGGGHLEFQAITEARALLSRPAHVNVPSTNGNLASAPTHEDNALTTRYALGPALGQCCGGVVHLKFERISAADAPALKQRLLANSQPLALFGGGHVGRALVNVLFNAVKFSPPHCKISIQVSHVEEVKDQTLQAIIRVTNPVNVTPVSQDLAPSMPGFGLGLDFVDNVIHKHQGTITRNIPKNGTATIAITLPCTIN